MTLKTGWEALREAAHGWIDANATRLSAALAFYTILSIAPLFVIAIAIAGAVFGDEAASGALTEQLRGLLGEAGAEVAKTAIQRADKPNAGIIATVIGVVTLLFGASGVFNELQSSLNAVWDVKPKSGRGIWAKVRDRFLSFGMVLVIGFLLLISLVLSTALNAFGGFLDGLAPGVPTLMWIANFLLSFAIVTVLFALMFKYLPDARVAWTDVWFGATVTAVLFTIGKYLIGLYLGKAGVGTPYGAAGSLVAFVVWVYYSGLIVFFGAELTQVGAKRAGRAIQPTANAEPAGEKHDDGKDKKPA